MSTIEARLRDLAIQLPAPAAPAANYVPFVRQGALVHISGQVSALAGKPITGVVGEDLTAEEAAAAARVCGINLIAQMKAACDGDLERVRRVVKLCGFIQAGPGFHALPTAMNGCSDLMVEVFGDAGRHARSTVGVYRLPSNYAVEVDALVEIAP